MIYYLLLTASGGIVGAGSVPELPIPANCIACTQAEAETWQTLEIVNGAIQAIPAAQLLAQAQTAQRAIIKSSFIDASTANVTDSNGIVWESGMQSGNSIFLGCQLAQQAGQTTITLYDASKAPHSMTIAEGMGVAALIGGAYQQALATKNGQYAEIDAATSVAAVQAIVWP